MTATQKKEYKLLRKKYKDFCNKRKAQNKYKVLWVDYLKLVGY